MACASHQQHHQLTVPAQLCCWQSKAGHEGFSAHLKQLMYDAMLSSGMSCAFARSAHGSRTHLLRCGMHMHAH